MKKIITLLLIHSILSYSQISTTNVNIYNGSPVSVSSPTASFPVNSGSLVQFSQNSINYQLLLQFKPGSSQTTCPNGMILPNPSDNFYAYCYQCASNQVIEYDISLDGFNPVYNIECAHTCFYGGNMTINQQWNPSYGSCQRITEIKFMHRTIYLSNAHRIKVNGTFMDTASIHRGTILMMDDGTYDQVREKKVKINMAVNIWTNGSIIIDGVEISSNHNFDPSEIVENPGTYNILQYALTNAGKYNKHINNKVASGKSYSPTDYSCFPSELKKQYGVSMDMSHNK